MVENADSRLTKNQTLVGMNSDSHLNGDENNYEDSNAPDFNE